MKETVLEELDRLVGKCPDSRVVYLDDDDQPTIINCVELDDVNYDEWRYILQRDPEVENDLTVAKLKELLSDPDPESDDAEVLVRDDNGLWYVYDGNASVFFEYTLGGEKVIAFRRGDDASDEDGFWDEDDE